MSDAIRTLLEINNIKGSSQYRIETLIDLGFGKDPVLATLMNHVSDSIGEIMLGLGTGLVGFMSATSKTLEQLGLNEDQIAESDTILLSELRKRLRN